MSLLQVTQTGNHMSEILSRPHN